MRSLVRPKIETIPEVKHILEDAQVRGLPWGDFDLGPIRKELRVMQSGYCAYCGRKLSDDDQQTRIDHFEPRSTGGGGHRVYDWTNFYLSCDTAKTCDSHKHDSTDAIINPDCEDPDHFICYKASGSVNACKNLNEIEAEKANNTIRVLNLNYAALSAARIVSFNRWKKAMSGKIEIMRKNLMVKTVEYHSFCEYMVSRD